MFRLRIHNPGGFRPGMVLGFLTVLAFCPSLAAQRTVFQREIGHLLRDAGRNQIAGDASGVYVMGERLTTAGPNAGPWRAVLAKYGTSGNELWARQIPGPEQIWAGGVAATRDGIYAVAAVDYRSLASRNDILVLKYDANGTESWTRRITGESPGPMAADSTGVYVLSFTYDQRILLRKYDSAGREVWPVRQLDMFFPAASADGSGLYLGGGATLRRYDRNGVQLWERSIVRGFDRITADSSGVYLASSRPDLGFELRKLSAAGEDLWTSSSAEAEIYIRGIAVDSTGIYLTGSAAVPIPGQCSAGNFDAMLNKYDASGKEIWSRRFGTRFDDVGAGVALLEDRVYVAGAWLDYRGWSSPSGSFLAKFEASSDVPSASRPRIFPQCVVNAGSHEGGGIAPGEIVTLLGDGIGPAEPARAGLTNNGRLPTVLAQTRVLFNGIAAPLISVSERQTTAIVPYGIGASATSVDVRVEYRGVLSDAETVPMLRSRPGFFSAVDMSPDQYAPYRTTSLILNEDGSRNSESNPAAPGSIVTAFLTGEGVIAPPVADGAVVNAPAPAPVERVTATLGDLEEVAVPLEILYAAGVPGSVAGLFQINVRLPMQRVPQGWLEITIGTERTAAVVAVR